jgi:aminopeptidase N
MMMMMMMMTFVPRNATSGWVEDHFEQSMVMPTYLLAFIVCDYKSLSDMVDDGVNSR